MSDDNMREYLITKLRCADCGQILKLTYDEPKCKKEYMPSASSEPSGGFMVQQFVYVKPCVACKYKSDRIKDAVRIIIEESESKE